MLRIKDTRYPNTASFLKSAVCIAEYYGFRPFEEAPRMDPAGMRQLRQRAGKNEAEPALARKEERLLVAAARRCAFFARAPGGSLLLWRTASDLKSAMPHVSLELHVLGTNSAVAEALLIVVANSIAEEAGLRMFCMPQIRAS